MLIPLIGLLLGLFFFGAGVYSSITKDFSPKLLFGGMGLIALSFVCVAVFL